MGGTAVIVMRTLCRSYTWKLSISLCEAVPPSDEVHRRLPLKHRAAEILQPCSIVFYLKPDWTNQVTGYSNLALSVVVMATK